MAQHLSAAGFQAALRDKDMPGLMIVVLGGGGGGGVEVRGDPRINNTVALVSGFSNTEWKFSGF